MCFTMYEVAVQSNNIKSQLSCMYANQRYYKVKINFTCLFIKVTEANRFMQFTHLHHKIMCATKKIPLDSNSFA